jgi:nucleotide-binding universal stress UspA family protein
VSEGSQAAYALAVMDFRRARRKAALQELLTRLAGGRRDLLSYEQVRDRLRAKETPSWKLEDIPLDSIVGSMGRYKDFTRDFLPLERADEGRWARVKVAMNGAAGLPPIEVYRLGGAHFVLDGNHRVSVARELGASHIQAYVREVQIKVSLSPDVQPDDLIIKAEQAEFLERTRLDEIRPAADLTVTSAGRYDVLEGQIRAHRHSLQLQRPGGVGDAEVVGSWFDRVYLPAVHSIRRISLLREFPARTEADLYVWITQHQADLERSLGWEIRPESAAADLAARAGRRFRRIVGRIVEKTVGTLTLAPWIPAPAPAQWPAGVLATHERAGFSLNILLPMGGARHDWSAVDQAVIVAEREGARLLGLCVLRSDTPPQRQAARDIQLEFERRSQAAGVPSEFAVEVGEIATQICDRARWADLVILKLSYPPGPRLIARLRSGVRAIVQSCPRPVLAVPGAATRLDRALLAFDGSSKSEEALYLATYLAGRWKIPLVVLTVREGDRVGEATLGRAVEYARDHDVEPVTELKTGPVDEAILAAAREHACNLILMGGYGLSPLLEFALGSAVDKVLRKAEVPVLICR